MGIKNEKREKKLIEEAVISSYHNSFDFLRVIFAMMVLYTHAFSIGGFGPVLFHTSLLTVASWYFIESSTLQLKKE